MSRTREQCFDNSVVHSCWRPQAIKWRGWGLNAHRRALIMGWFSGGSSLMNNDFELDSHSHSLLDCLCPRGSKSLLFGIVLIQEGSWSGAFDCKALLLLLSLRTYISFGNLTASFAAAFSPRLILVILLILQTVLPLVSPEPCDDVCFLSWCHPFFPTGDDQSVCQGNRNTFDTSCTLIVYWWWGFKNKSLLSSSSKSCPTQGPTFLPGFRPKILVQCLLSTDP